MGLSSETFAEAQAALDAREVAADADTRAVICSCGHPVGKHADLGGRTMCKANGSTCPCRETRSTLKAPNGRAFSFKSDEAGHAVAKGIGKSVELGLGERLDWVATCTECGGEPVTVVRLDDGARNEARCGTHR